MVRIRLAIMTTNTFALIFNIEKSNFLYKITFSGIYFFD